MNILKVRNSILLAALLVVTAVACKKDDFAINTQPDDITASTVDYRSVLTSSEASTAALVANQWRFLQHWMGFWARSGSYQSETEIETYRFTNDFGVGIWNGFYTNATNYNFVIKEANARGAGRFEAIARIMKAQDFQYLVDVYGNIPYSEAFKGTGIATPKYDDDAAIYTDLLRQLDTAITIMKDPVLSSIDANPSIATNDLVYAGDPIKWIKYANTLKLKLLMHMSSTKFSATGAEVNSYVPGSDVVAEMAIVAAEPNGFIMAGGSAQVNPGYSGTKPNPFYRQYVKSETGTTSSAGDISKANIYAVGSASNGYYQYNGDPRVDRFYIKPVGATLHRGITFGETSGFDPNDVGNKLSFIYGPGLLPNNEASRAWIFTSVESLFLQAEAIYRGLLPGTPATAMRDAVRESFVWLGLTTVQADAYLALNAGYPDVDITAPNYAPNTPAGGIYTIMSQKWFALNTIATLEVWTDYRRTDIVYGVAVDYDPGPPLSIFAGAETKIPTRLYYPQNEYNYNATNVAGEGSINLQNPSPQNRIFWDLN